MTLAMAPMMPSAARPVRRGWRATTERPFPTLGWQVLDWTYAYLPSPANEKEPLVYTAEQARRILEWFRLDPLTGRYVHDRRLNLEESKGFGKALALDTPIPTPTGWTTMGAIRVGDEVCDDLGHPTRVLAAHDVIHGHDCYSITFDDGSVIVADAEHLWETEMRTGVGTGSVRPGGRGRWRLATRTTAEIAASLRYRNGAFMSANHSIRLAEPLHLPDAELPIEPYTLGVWLGDGDSDTARITMGDHDAEALTQELVAVGTGVGVRQRTHAAGRYTIGATRGRGGPPAPGSLSARLRRAGLLGRKHIPAAYLRASYPQRLALLQGLMDTDGYIAPASGACELSLSNGELAAGAHELILSLGIKATINEGRMTLAGLDVGPRWRMTFHPPATRPVFRLPRKVAHQRVRHKRRALSAERRIVRCDPVPSVPVRCIRVAAPASMFLAGRAMVPTHNSPFAASLDIVDFRGPVCFDGWDAHGQPVGVPWGTAGRPPAWIQIAAVSEGQTKNTWGSVYGMLGVNSGRAAEELRIDLGRTRMYLMDDPEAILEFVTASAGSREGQRITKATLDEPQLWTPGNGGHKLADTILGNLTKMDGRAVFTGNAYVKGASSVAERFDVAEPGALRYARRPAEEPQRDWPRQKLMASLRDVYADAWWVNLGRIADDATSATADWDRMKRLFWNMPSSGSAKRWLPEPVWEGCAGDVVMSPKLSTYAVVVIDHDHRAAAVAVAQHQGESVVVRVRPFFGPEGEYLALADIEDYLLSLRRRYPAYVLAAHRYTARGRERLAPAHGPEIAYHGTFFERSAQALREQGLVMVDFPPTPERMSLAAEALKEAAIAGKLVHDGDAELGRQMGWVTARETSRGWLIEPDEDQRIPAAKAAMISVHRALIAPPPPSRGIRHGVRR